MARSLGTTLDVHPFDGVHIEERVAACRRHRSGDTFAAPGERAATG
jgi:hypothetical protein